MLPFKLLSHTADVRLQVFGHNREELFQNAMFGLSSILFKDFDKLKKKLPAGFEKLKIEASDINALLVNFLNQVLTQSQINKKVYNRIKFLKFSEIALEAQIFGVVVDHFDEDVKAVTYHEAKIEQNKRGIFEITLTLDI